MDFETNDDERAFWNDEPRRPTRRRERTTGRHPVLSPRAAAIAAARTARPGTRRHGDPTGAVPVVPRATTPDTVPDVGSLADIWDDVDVPVRTRSIGSRGHHLVDLWDDTSPNAEVADRTTTPTGSRTRRDVARLRLGLLAAASVVLVPVAFTLDGGDDQLRTSTPAAAVALPGAGLVTTAPALTLPPTVVVAGGDPTSLTDPAGGTDPGQVSNDGGEAAEPAAAPAAAQAESLDAATTPTDPPTSAAAVTTVVATTPQETEAPATAPPATEAPTTEATTTTIDPAAAHAAAVASCGNTYEIAAGDYWIGIADAIDASLGDLLDLNAATVDTPLYAGREVCLPAGAHIAEPSTTTATTTTAAPATTTKPTTTTAPKSTTTTAAPATTTPKTTTTTEAPPKNTYTKAEVEAIIREVWPDDLEDEAVRIATRESNLIPTVRNYCCYGLFQLYYSVHKTWLAQIGVTSANQLYDPRVNATAAYTLYQRSGSWAPWAL